MLFEYPTSYPRIPVIYIVKMSKFIIHHIKLSAYNRSIHHLSSGLSDIFKSKISYKYNILLYIFMKHVIPLRFVPTHGQVQFGLD